MTQLAVVVAVGWSYELGEVVQRKWCSALRQPLHYCYQLLKVEAPVVKATVGDRVVVSER